VRGQSLSALLSKLSNIRAFFGLRFLFKLNRIIEENTKRRKVHRRLRIVRPGHPLVQFVLKKRRMNLRIYIRYQRGRIDKE
jgi:hypothetical protein